MPNPIPGQPAPNTPLPSDSKKQLKQDKDKHNKPKDTSYPPYQSRPQTNPMVHTLCPTTTAAAFKLRITVTPTDAVRTYYTQNQTH